MNDAYINLAGSKDFILTDVCPPFANSAIIIPVAGPMPKPLIPWPPATSKFFIFGE